MVKQISKRKLIFLVFFLVVFVLSMQSRKIGGDDVNFTNQIIEQGRMNWLISRYFNWSGRIFSDLCAAIFLPMNKFFWAIANSFFATLLLYSINKFSSNKTYRGLLFASISLGYLALGVFVDSFFWITGSFNYLWPISLGIFSLLLVANEYKNINTKHSFIFIFSAILACFGVEQMAACLVAFSFLANLSIAIKNKHLNLKLVIYFMTTLLSTIIVLLSPGSKIRVVEDSARWYPTFMKLNVVEKISNGIAWQFNYWVHYLLPILLLLVFVILYYYYWHKSANTKGTVFLLITCCVTIGSFFILGTKSFFNSFNNLQTTTLLGYAVYFFWLLFFFIIYYATVQISTDKIEDFFIILATLASAALMFFSPTILASGPRSLAVPSILTIVLINKLVDLEHFSNKVMIYLSIYPLLSLIIYSHWLMLHGFAPHSFW